MPVVEIATFPASDALIADHDLALGSLEILKKAEGFLGAWTGYDIADKKTAYLAVTWESLDAHKKLQSSPSYPEVIEKLRPALAGPLAMSHVEFDKDHTVAFNAPVTEILNHKLKEGKTKEELDRVIAEQAAFYADAKGIRHPQAHGPVLETPGAFISIVGWDSIEAYKAVATAETTQAQVAPLLALVDIKPAHVHFEKRG